MLQVGRFVEKSPCISLLHLIILLLTKSYINLHNNIRADYGRNISKLSQKVISISFEICTCIPLLAEAFAKE